jgi:hypothetical protein
LQNPSQYENKFYRNFSFVYNLFSQPLENEINRRFCYKVYFNKINLRKIAFEFINEEEKIEYVGYFNESEQLEKIDAVDNSRARMNMEFIYNQEKTLTNVKLFDDSKKLFSQGNVSFSDKGRLMFITFALNEASTPLLFHMVRSNENKRDIEIATYSANGTLFSNHLYFYDTNNNLSRYEFYRKLKFETGLIFLPNGQIRKIKSEQSSLAEENKSNQE